MRYTTRVQPVGTLEQVGRHRPKRTNLLDRLTALTRHDHAGDDRLFVHVQPAAALVDHFHDPAPYPVRPSGNPLSTDFAVRASPRGATLGGASGRPGQLKRGLSAPMKNR